MKTINLYETATHLLSPSTVRTDSALTVVYPAINSEAFALTMQNYRQYVTQYNESVKKRNALVDSYNEQIVSAELFTPIDIQAIKMFMNRTEDVYNIEQYNLEVEQFNLSANKVLVKKKRFQTVKYATEMIFSTLLYVYNLQLMKRNTQFMALKVAVESPIAALKINSHTIAQWKRDNAIALDICPKTVRNHKRRMEEAGILTDHFVNGWRPTEAFINPSILCVFCLKTSKIVVTENQSVKDDLGKDLPDYIDSTSTLLNKNKIKANVDNHSQDKEFAPLTPGSFVFYKNTVSKVKDSSSDENTAQVNLAAAREIAPRNELSDFFLSKIEDRAELAQGLAAGNYLQYTAIDLRILTREAYSGTMSKEQFRELILQDFLKLSSKLWRHEEVFPGVWMNAIKLLADNFLQNFQGVAFQKHLILDEIQQLRWRIAFAVRYSAKNSAYNLLYPSQYFDPTRKTAKEGGFAYTKAAWKKHLGYLDKKEAEKKKRLIQAEKRAIKIAEQKKLNRAVNDFMKDRKTLPQLYKYVQDNLSKSWLEKLPSIIENKLLTK